VSNIYSSLPPLFRPKAGTNYGPSAFVGEVPVRPGAYAYPFPDRIPGLGQLRVEDLDGCSECAESSWAVYGETVLCVRCADGLWRMSRLGAPEAP